MPLNDYYGTAYDQGYDPYYRPIVPQGSISNWVGHLTADDNGAAQVIDPGKLYQMLTGPMQDQQRKRADMDKQLRLSYMNYEPGKVPGDFLPSYQKAYQDYADFFQNNSKGLSRGDPQLAQQLQQKQNNVKDVAAQSILQGQKKKEYTSFITAHAHQKDPEWAEKALSTLKGLGIDDDIDAKMAPFIQSNDKVDYYKLENEALKPMFAKTIQTGTTPTGSPIYQSAAPTQDHLNKINDFLKTTAGKARIEQYAQDNGLNYDEAKQQYITRHVTEMDNASLRNQYMPKYDEHVANENRAEGIYQMKRGLYPLEIKNLQTGIEARQQQINQGNAAKNRLDYEMNNIIGPYQNDPAQFLKNANQLAGNKSIYNRNAFTYKDGKYHATLMGKSGGTPIQFDAPATPEGAQQALEFMYNNQLINPTVSGDVSKIQRGTAQNQPAAQQQQHSVNHTPSQPAQPQHKQKVASMQQIKNLVGRKGFEGYSEKELVDYYKGLGYTIK